MADKKGTLARKKIDFDLRVKSSDEPHDPNAKRFDFFLIDTAWNTDVSKAVHSHLKALMSIESKEAFYVLSQQQSFELLKGSPDLIGHDPIILVYDHYARPDRMTRGYHGFRLNLGLIKDPSQALARLQEFLRFVAMNRDALHLQTAVRRELYREGLDGLVKIFRETSIELV